uniref:Putative secreted protein n=1 Tax=Ixodes ricinus TaxID=34613 RepID=A0A6B0U601_IXORI
MFFSRRSLCRWCFCGHMFVKVARTATLHAMKLAHGAVLCIRATKPRFSKMATPSLGTMPASSRKRFTVTDGLCLLREIVGRNPFVAP